MSRARVLVVGAGIAGAALSILLGRAGVDVTLVERSGTVRTSGAPVDLRGGALPVARRLRLDDAFRAADTGTQRVVFVDREGRPTATLPARAPGSSDIEISRASLSAGLTDEAATIAEMVQGDEPTSIVSDGTGSDVTFASGASGHFDLVVGADGQHSTVRRMVWGPETTFRTPVGLAIATVPAPVRVDPRDILLHNEPGVSVGIHPAGGHPIASFIFRTRARDVPRGREARGRMVRDHYSGVGWRAAELLALLDESDDLYLDVVSRVRTPSWASGRIALLGDAASSVTILGDGASMAMIGAARLADALAGAPDIPTALVRYEAAHRPEVERHQRAVALGVAFLAPRDRLGIAVRDRLIRFGGGRRMRVEPAPQHTTPS